MSEGLQLDHIVFATGDVARTSAWLADVTGVRPSPGGPHVGRGTRNELVSLGNGAYLEIIGPDPEQPEPDQPRPFGLDRLAAQGVVTWCARCDDIAAFVDRAARAGLPFDGPTAMSRRAPSGLLSWQLALPVVDTAAGLVPFVIDWGDTAHPADTVEARLELVSVHGRHLDPPAVRRVLADMGVELELQSSPLAGLRVTVRGPGGEVMLPTAAFGSSSSADRGATAAASCDDGPPPSPSPERTSSMTDETLTGFRARIDQLDEQLIRLLAERFEITKAVGAYKANAGLPPADPAREMEQIARLRAIAEDVGMDPVFSEKVFRLIVDEVIHHHERIAEERADGAGGAPQ